jgi:hypothetical protein
MNVIDSVTNGYEYTLNQKSTAARRHADAVKSLDCPLQKLACQAEPAHDFAYRLQRAR